MYNVKSGRNEFGPFDTIEDAAEFLKTYKDQDEVFWFVDLSKKKKLSKSDMKEEKMAEATVVTKKSEPVEPRIIGYELALELSVAEAKALKALTGMATGSGTIRAILDKIYYALENERVESDESVINWKIPKRS